MIINQEKEILKAINLTPEDVSGVKKTHANSLSKFARFVFEKPLAVGIIVGVTSGALCLVGLFNDIDMLFAFCGALFLTNIGFITPYFYEMQYRQIKYFSDQKILEKLKLFNPMDIYNLLAHKSPFLSAEQKTHLHNALKSQSFDPDQAIDLQNTPQPEFITAPIIKPIRAQHEN